MSHKMQISIAIADDHSVYRDGLLSILNEDSFLIVGEVDNGEKILNIARKQKPDIILMDIKMPIMDGIEATKIITAEIPVTQVIALSMHDEESYISEMVDAGAKGYVVKSSDKKIVLDAINKVYNGIPFFSQIPKNTFTHIFSTKNRYNNSAIKFNEKEVSIIKLICDEFTSEEIADKMVISKRTVDGLRLRLEDKLNVKNIAGIVKYAIQKGIYKLK
jgi:DNA-binding NarL/FixJ family response regulator